MLYRLRRSLGYWRFNRMVSAIHDTLPLPIVDSGLRIVSMVAVPRDLPMYLLAAKTLYRRIGHGRFVMLPDRPLPETWRECIRRHFDDAVSFCPLADIPVGPVQRGGCWERLLACLDLSAEHYVIQMDCDTLALGDIPEIREAVAANRAFTMAEGLPLQSFAEAAAWAAAQDSPPTHIVGEAQLAFARHPRRDSLRYIRGSAGFTGFARGAATRADAALLHQEMEALLGRDRWRIWGTEQVASNVLIANSPNPLPLPYPDYSCVVRFSDLGVIRFAHFIGTDRFYRQRFARLGRRLIRDLLRDAA
jgi:hypothetical protein